MTYLYLDIETIPAQSPDAVAYLAKSAKVDSRLKDPAKIDAARAEAEQKAISNTSFDGWFGQICCIAFALDDADVVSMSDADHDEVSMISALFSNFSDYHRPVIVGHNIGFDMRFITRRAILLGVELPPSYLWPRDIKPWSDKIHDTSAMTTDRGEYISLDRLCHAMRIPGKDGFDGSMVAEAWANGEHAKIAEYCADDVRRVRSVHQRFLAAGWTGSGIVETSAERRSV